MVSALSKELLIETLQVRAELGILILDFDDEDTLSCFIIYSLGLHHLATCFWSTVAVRTTLAALLRCFAHIPLEVLRRHLPLGGICGLV